ncbi:MAG: HAMP domain-containing sensor histidine kinase [Halapricum sp.]
MQRQNERLEEFSDVLSHDVRNPLSVAESNLELAREEYDNEHLAAVKQAHDRIEELVDGLLESAREGTPLKRGGHASETLDIVKISTLVDECWQSVDTDVATLNNETTVEVRADRTRLAQLLENLIRNAVEHRSGNSRSSSPPADAAEADPTTNADAVEDGDPEVTITVGDLKDARGFYVADDGPGIPAAKRDRIFDRAYSTAHDGLGLGLHIVKQIVDARDWTISVTDSASGGARFEIVVTSE